MTRNLFYAAAIMSYYAKNEKSVNAELGRKLEKYGK